MIIRWRSTQPEVSWTHRVESQGTDLFQNEKIPSWIFLLSSIIRILGSQAGCEEQLFFWIVGRWTTLRQRRQWRWLLHNSGEKRNDSTDDEEAYVACSGSRGGGTCESRCKRTRSQRSFGRRQWGERISMFLKITMHNMLLTLSMFLTMNMFLTMGMFLTITSTNQDFIRSKSTCLLPVGWWAEELVGTRVAKF